MGNTTNYHAILFFILLTIIFFMWWDQFISYKHINTRCISTLANTNIVDKSKLMSVQQLTSLNFRYILVWTLPTSDPIMNLEVANRAFIKRKCPNTNCYVSSNRNFFNSVTQFDVILFHGRDIIIEDLPKLRSSHQKYVFASMESSDYYPICSNLFNDYFNWTWTYKLDSDEEYGYISIRDKRGVKIGPKKEMQWMKVEDMEQIDETLKKKLDKKKHAAAWFVSNCQTPSKRERVAEKLKIEMAKHNLTLDIYGACYPKICPKFTSKQCLRLLETDYYFYLSFENSFSNDYVTEKLLNALQNYAVPVVFGGANYTRFMPDGIYLDARKLTIIDLAKEMGELIKNKEKYYSYFKWHNHYSYHNSLESPQSDAYCRLCSMINDDRRFKKTSVYPHFVQWWNPPNRCNAIVSK